MTAISPSAVTGTPRQVLMIEGLAIAAVCVAIYFFAGLNWWLFALLILAPDLGMIGYLVSPRLGALTYNVLHFTALPLALGLCG